MTASYSCSDSKVILKISQAKGLRDPKCGYNFEPFGFIKRVGNEFERDSSLSKKQQTVVGSQVGLLN